jgi:hypothetical protein
MRAPLSRVSIALLAITACGGRGGGAVAGSGSGAAFASGGSAVSGTPGAATGDAVGLSGSGSGPSGDVTSGVSGGALSGAATTGTAAGSGTVASSGAVGAVDGGLDAGDADAADRDASDSGMSGTDGAFVMCDDHADFNGRGLCSPTAKFGAVVATETLVDVGSAQTNLAASFGASKAAIDPGCTEEAVGAACTAFSCARTGNTPGEPQAGTITAKSSGGFIAITPDPTGVYAQGVLTSALWTKPKSALTFAAAGGVIPAFSDTFCGPTSAMITMPSSPPGSGPGRGLSIDRSVDLAVQWTGGAVGDLEVAITDDTAAAARIDVRCFFTGASGQGTVPQAALVKISPGTHSIASNMWVRKISLPTGTCVELTGVITNVSAAGAIPFNGDAMFR